jgi:hypothetical protein
MLEELMSIILAIIIGFALIVGGISIIATNLIMGIGFLVAGVVAIAFGIRVFL